MASSGVLFVCTGNICRSPTADGVFRHRVRTAGLAATIRVDSAGTHDYHVGAAPDARAQAHAIRRGYDLSTLRARQVTRGDFDAFDLILAMDRDHLRFLRRIAPDGYAGLRLFMTYASDAEPSSAPDVPDPYYGGADGFERVLDMIERAADGLLRSLAPTDRD
jgi:protein-tyrosine phosphatase